jgi:PKD repeat protein
MLGRIVMNQNLIPLALSCILITVFLAAPVSAGLSISDGAMITTRTGSTSPVINITGTTITEGGTITIDVSALNGDVWNGTFMNANVVVTDGAAAADWTGEVTGSTLTLTSSGGPTEVGENITITFTGAAGSPWVSDTGGGIWSAILTATRTDTLESTDFNFAIQTSPGPGGLTIAPGEKITTADGVTSMVITVTDAPILQYDTITIYLADLDQYVAGGGPLTDTNVVVHDTAANATWTGALEWGTLTLTSNNGATDINETVTVTFTGAGGSAWSSNTQGEQTVILTAFRMDNFGSADFTFTIDTTPPPGGLTILPGAKIIASNGTTSTVITIADTEIAQDGTITINVTDLNRFVASGTFLDTNIIMDDTSANATWTGAVAGNTLTLTSTGNSTIAGETVNVTFTGAAGNPWILNSHGEQNVSLIVLRSDGFGWNTFNFVIETGPPPGLTLTANFSASPTSDIAPLAVTFTDTSQGSPTSWSWDFGDGDTTNATMQNPVHTYLVPGIYTVSLNATNAYGSDTKTEWNYIYAHRGAVRESNTAIAGLTVSNCAGPQSVTVNTTLLQSALTPNNSVLEIQPPPESGFKNIIIYAKDGTGFSINGNFIYGNPSGVHMVSEDIAPASGFSNEIGTGASFNYSIDLPSYPCNALLSTKIWEGGIPEYESKLLMITSNNSAVPIGTAYTARITKTNFPFNNSVKIHTSVNASWNPSLSGGPGNVYIWRIADNGNSGQILPTTFTSNNPVNNLDFYEADSPLGLSIFGISSLTGSNNPFQLIVFAIETAVNPGSPASSQNSQGGGGSGANTIAITSTQIPGATPAPQDPGKTAKIYANAGGVITQATDLQSTDGLATVHIGTGIVAKDARGKPLSSITIKTIREENLPDTPPGASLSFAGRAYEILPDGAAFSPGITISFTAPNVQFGQELMVKMYDHATDTWHDVPSSINPETGIITAHISHFCCFALFAETVTPESIPGSTPAPPLPKGNAPAPTAMSTFVGMILWAADLIQKNMILFIGILILAAGIFLYGRKRRRDRLMYLF